MKIQRILAAKNQYVWLVLDDDFRPIEPIEVFIRYLHYTEKSPNTLQSYASHLKLFWEYLAASHKHWQSVNISDFAEFVHWLRSQAPNIVHLSGNLEIRRSERTVNTILSSLSSFYRHHNQLGNTDIKLTEACYLPVNRHKSLLHHVFKHKPVWKRVIGLKAPRNLPKTITTQNVSVLLEACCNERDRFLIALLHETGMRIGQALALRHEDIKSWDNEIHVIFRKDNENQSRNKSRTPNVLHVSPELMQAYTQYLHAYPMLVNDSEYVFINFINKSSLCYSAVRKLFTRLNKKAGFYITPHMLRHTHATELIRNGWDPALIQKRLGHANVQTTIDTYVHVNQQDMKNAFQRYQNSKKGVK